MWQNCFVYFIFMWVWLKDLLRDKASASNHIILQPFSMQISQELSYITHIRGQKKVGNFWKTKSKCFLKIWRKKQHFHARKDILPQQIDIKKIRLPNCLIR